MAHRYVIVKIPCDNINHAWRLIYTIDQFLAELTTRGDITEPVVATMEEVEQ